MSLVRALLLASILASPRVAMAQAVEGAMDPVAFLESLRGRWSFELFRAGETHPTRTGTRVFLQPIEGHPMLTWTEEFAGTSVVVTGVFGYDPSRSRFYELGAPPGGPTDYWFGELSPDGRHVRWEDPLDDASPARGELTIVSGDRFEFTTEAFRAVFVRSPGDS